MAVTPPTFPSPYVGTIIQTTQARGETKEEKHQINERIRANKKEMKQMARGSRKADPEVAQKADEIGREQVKLQGQRHLLHKLRKREGKIRAEAEKRDEKYVREQFKKQQRERAHAFPSHGGGQANIQARYDESGFQAQGEARFGGHVGPAAFQGGVRGSYNNTSGFNLEGRAQIH